MVNKSIIKQCKECSRQLYLELRFAELKKLNPDAFMSYLANEGHKFEDIAIFLFPGAQLQKTFTSNGVLVRTDILDGNILIEVKSSTSIRNEDILDLGIQVSILKELGIDLEKYQLAFVNNGYVLASKLNPKQMVKIVDVTKEVDAILPEVESMIAKARKTAKAKRSPKKEIGRHCLDCPFVESCSPELLEASLFNLRRGGKKIDDNTTSGKKREIYNSLLQYCKMDTYAMYAIVEALREVCHEFLSRKESEITSIRSKSHRNQSLILHSRFSFKRQDIFMHSSCLLRA